ncbi:MAG: nitronate monooxygenase [Chloroflexi bacterium]|nr:nitronate monooxygenase [Chloroflexota bacterium]
MGVGVSNWELARAVALAGKDLHTPVLGVVSGTGVEILLVRRLQDGDPGGHMRRALAAFPLPRIAHDILNTYYCHVRKPSSARYRNAPQPSELLGTDHTRARAMNELSVVANFVEVWLAKEGHDGPVGINHLEKIQLLHLARLFGAMLAGVDYVLEGAGIPDQVPGILDRFANQEPAHYKIDVSGAREKLEVSFDPTAFHGGFSAPHLIRPGFLAIISSNLLAKVLLDSRRVSGNVDGFVVEGPSAGGHNAPPRGKFELNHQGEPVYGEKDRVRLDQLARLGPPFWLAGSYGRPEKLAMALDSGATGIQAGTIFALAEESGMRPDLKRTLRQLVDEGGLDIATSSVASPTGFPFKVARMGGTLFEQEIYENRKRRCNIAHLVRPYKTATGKIGFRCPAEPVKAYAQKGGNPEDTRGSLCICNGLSSTAGYAQRDKLGLEPPVITLGDDVSSILGIPRRDDGSYTAKDALRYLLGTC